MIQRMTFLFAVIDGIGNANTKRRNILVSHNRVVKGFIMYLLATLPCAFISTSYEILVEHKSLEYGLNLMASYMVLVVALPIVIFLTRPLFHWLDKLEDKLRGANSQKRE
jgi:hypothetical protein